MASIERTAYPRFKRYYTAKELQEIYTPTPSEIAFGRTSTTGEDHYLNLIVLLKSFQRLGYFPKLSDIPDAVINYIRTFLKLPPNLDLSYQYPQTLSRHKKAIRSYLQVSQFNQETNSFIREIIFESALVMDNPADLINVAIEELVKNRSELPSFATLDRLVCYERNLVNQQLFAQVISQLSQSEQQRLNDLLDSHSNKRSDYNELKKLPKKSSRNHLNDLLVHLTWLETLLKVQDLIKPLTASKIKHFAAEAKALNAGELKDITIPKRLTLLLCLIYTAQVQTRDSLVEMFLKQMKKIQNKAKDELEIIRQKNQETTEKLVSVLTNVLEVFQDQLPDSQAVTQIQGIFQPQGGVESLLDECEAVNAYKGNNHLPLLWRFYKSHRSSFLRVINALKLASTSSDERLIKAVEFLLQNAHRRGALLPAEVDLSFTSETWRKLVLVEHNNQTKMVRRHWEVCLFSYLAADGTKYDLYEQNLLSEYHIRVRREVALLSVSAIPLIAMKPVIPLTVPYQDMRLRQRNGMKLLEQRSRSRKTNAAHRKKDSVPTSTKCGSELRLSGMVIKRKSLLNVVRHDKPKVLIGLNQKVHSQVQELRIFLSRTPRLSAKKGDLTHSGNKVEHGKPVQSPVVGKPTVREAFDCAGKGGWKKPRLLCNGADRD